MKDLPLHPNLLPNEIATFLRVDRSTVYLWIDMGIIPAKKIGGRYRIPRDQFLDWYKKQDLNPSFVSD